MGFSRQEYWSGLPFPSPREDVNNTVSPRQEALYRIFVEGKHRIRSWILVPPGARQK